MSELKPITLTVLITEMSGIPEIEYIGDREGAKAVWEEMMKGIESSYANRPDIRNEDGTVSCDLNGGDITTRNSWDYGYFMRHKTEYRLDSMTVDREALDRLLKEVNE